VNKDFLATVSQCFQYHTNKLLRKRDSRGDCDRRFCIPQKVINGSFSTTDRRFSFRVSGFGAERVLLFHSEFLHHPSTVV